MVTVVVPTLAVGDALEKCLNSLELQTLDLFDVVVVDNSGVGRARVTGSRTRVIVNQRNEGFAGAVNQGIRDSRAVYVATLNDDAIADRRWLETLIACAESHPQAGMFACEVRLMGTLLLDSAGMLIAADGSSKQRGHERPAADFMQAPEALFPSGSAALYRRSMLDHIGLFDESFFLYCEDTDLGLRARWAGWDCRYVPGRGGGALLFPLCRSCDATQGVLYRAQSSLYGTQEFSHPLAVASPLRLCLALLLAFDRHGCRSGERSGVSPVRVLRRSASAPGAARIRRYAWPVTLSTG